MDYRIFNVRTWSFVCVRAYTRGVGHTDSESAQHFWLGKNLLRSINWATMSPLWYCHAFRSALFSRQIREHFSFHFCGVLCHWTPETIGCAVCYSIKRKTSDNNHNINTSGHLYSTVKKTWTSKCDLTISYLQNNFMTFSLSLFLSLSHKHTHAHTQTYTLTHCDHHTHKLRMSPWSLCTLYWSHAQWRYCRWLGSLLLCACSICDVSCSSAITFHYLLILTIQYLKMLFWVITSLNGPFSAGWRLLSTGRGRHGAGSGHVCIWRRHQ